MTEAMAQRLASELAGSALLLATVVGSGIMAENLAGGNLAVALLGNTIPTGAILYVLITMFGPVSGAHFNPAVTFAFWLRGEIAGAPAMAYGLAQIAGAIGGVLLANAMFDLPVFQISEKLRSSPGQWLSEAVAAFGLVLAILMALRSRPDTVPAVVGLYITAAYWFTASTAFANPAVTVARQFSDTFAGIAPSSVTFFIAAQMAGAALAFLFERFLVSPRGGGRTGAE